MAAIAWVATGALWSHHEALVRPDVDWRAVEVPSNCPCHDGEHPGGWPTADRPVPSRPDWRDAFMTDPNEGTRRFDWETAIWQRLKRWFSC